MSQTHSRKVSCQIKPITAYKDPYYPTAVTVKDDTIEGKTVKEEIVQLTLPTSTMTMT